MSFEHWLVFAAASVVLLLIPGPTVLLVVSYALGHGRRAAGAVVAGVALGDFIAMTACMAGLGAVLTTSALLATALRWAGGAYLVYLGWKLWRTPVADLAVADKDGGGPDIRPRRIFVHTCAVTTLNPKTLVFFVAVVPRFLDVARPLPGQMMVLEATFVALAALSACFYTALGTSARSVVRGPRLRRAVNRVGGGLLMGVGLLVAGWRRTA